MREDAIVKIVHQCIDESPRIHRIEGHISGLNGDVATLKSDVSILKSDVAILKSDVSILKSDVTTLKSDVAILKSDVATLKSDVAILKSDVSILKSDVSILKTEVQRHGVLIEDMQSDIRKIVEVVMSTDRKIEEALRTRDTVKLHGDRLDAVESAVRRHVKNRRVHRGVEST